MSSVVSRKAMNILNKEINEIYKQAIKDCSEMYGFSVEEAMEKLSVNYNKSVEKKIRKEAGEKKRVIPLPWVGIVNELHCNNIKFNHGLYTQCPGLKLENGFCKGCKEASTEYFTVAERLSQGGDYKDSKNRKPIHYGKLLKKMEISEEEAQIEAGKNNIILTPDILNIVETEKKAPKAKKTSEGKKGRPKAVKAAVESENTEDLFDKLLNENKEPIVLSEEALAIEAQLKALEEAAAPKKAAAAAKKAEAAEKKAKAAAEKEAKKAEAAEKKAKAAAEKEAKKAESAPKKTKKAAEKKAEVAKEEAPKEEVKQSAPKVLKIKIEGVNYLWDKITKLVYDPESHEEIGVYDKEKNELELYLVDGLVDEEEDEEEEEEDYESENEF